MKLVFPAVGIVCALLGNGCGLSQNTTGSSLQMAVVEQIERQGSR